MLKGMPQTASQLLQMFLNQREVTRGLGFYGIWGTLSSITLNNDYLEVGDVIEDSVTPCSISHAIVLSRKHQSSTE